MIFDKTIFRTINTGSPNFLETDYALDWSMTRNERYCLTKLLEKLKPKVAIEIGTYNGGSLQVISQYAEKVYAIDTDSSIKERLKDKFDNVIFIVGDSKLIIPELITELQAKNESVEFALIDGDHSTLGVKTDIENLIHHIPEKSLNIILHDSFNPNCRKGMKAVNYEKNKYVHYVELDYISGVFAPDGLKKEMWGGFAHIVLLNEEREGSLIIHESQKNLYDIAYLHSKHLVKNKLQFLKPVIKFIKSGS